jgi:hypothetical protein
VALRLRQWQLAVPVSMKAGEPSAVLNVQL